MNKNLSNQEQIEIVKDFWKKYGNYILTAFIIFFVYVAGSRYIQKTNMEKRIHASVLYNNMLSSFYKKSAESNIERKKADDDDFKLFSENLIKRYKKYPYATIAGFFLAHEEIDRGDIGAAKKHLEQAAKVNSCELSGLAKIRLARILLNEKNISDAKKIAESTKCYSVLKNELLGDIYFEDKNSKMAASYYEKALNEINKDFVTTDYATASSNSNTAATTDRDAYKRSHFRLIKMKLYQTQLHLPPSLRGAVATWQSRKNK